MIFATERDIGLAIALDIRDGLANAAANSAHWTLGLPSGRSCLHVLRALASLTGVAWSPLRLAMLDAYCKKTENGYRHFDRNLHFSVYRFILDNVLPAIKASGGVGLGADQIWVPDPIDPSTSETQLRAHGVDLMLLASGSGDGHVAFNGPGTARESLTRVVQLADTTKRDNLRTYPQFDTIDVVPRSGVTLGIETIVAVSRRTVLVLPGAEKAATLAETVRRHAYDPDWPASVIHECQHGRIYTDDSSVRAASIPEVE